MIFKKKKEHVYNFVSDFEKIIKPTHLKSSLPVKLIRTA